QTGALPTALARGCGGRPGDVVERGEWLEHQLAELDREPIDPASIADLDAAHRRQAHSASLIAACDAVLARLDGDGHAALPRQLRQLQGELAGVQEHEPRLAEVDAMLDAAAIQVDEAGLLLERIRADLDVDPAQFDELERRITRLHELSRKHQVAPEGLAAQR